MFPYVGSVVMVMAGHCCDDTVSKATASGFKVLQLGQSSHSMLDAHYTVARTHHQSQDHKSKRRTQRTVAGADSTAPLQHHCDTTVMPHDTTVMPLWWCAATVPLGLI